MQGYLLVAWGLLYVVFWLIPTSAYRDVGAILYVVGLFFGILRACVGLAVKPCIGLIDCLSKVCEGIKNTVYVLQDKQRVRLAPHTLTPLAHDEPCPSLRGSCDDYVMTM